MVAAGCVLFITIESLFRCCCDLGGIFTRELVPEAVSCKNDVTIILRQIEYLNIRRMLYIRASIGRNRSPVTKFLAELMEVEFSELKSEIANRSAWHESTLDIASFRIASFANKNIIFALKFSL